MAATEYIEAVIHEALAVRNAYIEKMAAAFAKETGLLASECVLIEQRDGATVKYWYEKRSE